MGPFNHAQCREGARAEEALFAIPISEAAIRILTNPAVWTWI
jgi:hypothetical protein